MVSITLPEAAELNVSVYNIKGQQVAKLADGLREAGNHQFSFDASHLASGIYFLRARIPGQLDASRKLALIQ